MKRDFILWHKKYDERAARISGPGGLDRSHELDEGVPRAAGFPDGVRFEAEKRHKKATRLGDNHLANRSVVVSERLRVLLDAEQLAGVEFLPVTISDTKGKVHGGYFILHPIEPQDCLDLAASEPKYNTIVPTDIDWLKRLVVDTSRIAAERRICRIKHLAGKLLIERSLAEKLAAAPLDGVGFQELAAYEP